MTVFPRNVKIIIIVEWKYLVALYLNNIPLKFQALGWGWDGEGERGRARGREGGGGGEGGELVARLSDGNN